MPELPPQLEEALITAYKKNFGSAQNVRVSMDKANGEIKVFSRKTIVEEVTNPQTEISLEEAKSYLRVDSRMDDALIISLLSAAEKMTTDIARMTAAEWNAVCTDESVIVRSIVLDEDETKQLKSLLSTAVLYSLGYLYEHREEADHHDLMMTLRNLLSSVREGVF